MDEYAKEFYQLITGVELMESEEQQVTRYTKGLPQNFQDTFSMFDPWSISEAHQRAINLEK